MSLPIRSPSRSLIRQRSPWWLLLAITVLVSACGTKGPLVMPPKPAAAGSSSTASPTPLEQAATNSAAGRPLSLPSASDISTQGSTPR